MSKIHVQFSKVWFIVVVLALCLSVVGPAQAYALTPADGVTPPTSGPLYPGLALTWANQRFDCQRWGVFYLRSDGRFAKMQDFINKAQSRGKDVTNLQTALNALEAAVQAAKPNYDACKALVASHAGFGSLGKVTDASQAVQTVDQMHTDLEQLRASIHPAHWDWVNAIWNFRIANHQPSV